VNIAVLHRNRFHPLKTATAKLLRANTWEITIPNDEPALKKVRRGAQASDWDGAVFLIGDDETEPAMGSGEGAAVKVTAWIL